MAHTNSTSNYNLPQFLPTDKPAWLVDVNPAYASIDTAIKNASDAAASAQEDATQALADAAGAAATATQANTKADGTIASLAENFLDTATYAVGEYVVFNNILYVCVEPVTTPGPWTGSVNWARASVDSIATKLNNDINNLNDRTGSNIPVSDSDSTSVADKIDDLDEKANTTDFTFTPDAGVMASSITACKNDKLCIFSAEIRFTGNANSWTNLGYVDVTPGVNHVVTSGVNTSNGTYIGMVAIEQDGRVRIYPTSNISNNYVMFSLNFKTI